MYHNELDAKIKILKKNIFYSNSREILKKINLLILNLKLELEKNLNSS